MSNCDGLVRKIGQREHFLEVLKENKGNPIVVSEWYFGKQQLTASN